MHDLGSEAASSKVRGGDGLGLGLGGEVEVLVRNGEDICGEDI